MAPELAGVFFTTSAMHNKKKIRKEQKKEVEGTPFLGFMLREVTIPHTFAVAAYVLVLSPQLKCTLLDHRTTEEDLSLFCFSSEIHKVKHDMGSWFPDVGSGPHTLQ